MTKLFQALPDEKGWGVCTHQPFHYHWVASGLTEAAARDLAGRLESVLNSGVEDDSLRQRSGDVRVFGDRLTSFLYDLLKNMPAGQIEQMVLNAHPDISYSNGWLATYAQDLAARLRRV